MSEEIFEMFGHTRYAVSRSGKVINVRTRQELKPMYDRNGYARVKLFIKRGESVTYLLHRMVAELFVTRPEGLKNPVVCHKNHDKKDNRAENLYWDDMSNRVKSLHKENYYVNHLNELHQERQDRPIRLVDTENVKEIEFKNPKEAAIYIQSIKEVSSNTDVVQSLINYALRTHTRAYGYKWEEINKEVF